MSLPQITITPAGFAAIVNAEHDGTAPVRISHVGVTPQAFNVDTVGAAVPGEIKRISTFGGRAVAVDTLHLNIRDDSSDTYTLRGFGLYLSNGVLFAVYSQATPIMEKAAAATLLLATDIRFAKITATSIDVGDVDFVNPPATTTQVGVTRFATDQEAAAGSSGSVSMTPKGVVAYVNGRFGEGAPSAFVKTLMTKATAALLRAALELKSASLKDEGSNNGLDADLVDGQHGAYYLDWKNFTGIPTKWTPAPHEHPIAEVTGLSDALDGKVNKGGDTVIGNMRFDFGGSDVLRIANKGDGNAALQAVSKDGSAFAKLNLRGDSLDATFAGVALFNAPQLRVTAPAIPGGQYAGYILHRLEANTGNVDKLETQVYRDAATGNGWTLFNWRLGRSVDTTVISYMEFRGSGEMGVVTGKGSGQFTFATNGAFSANGGYDYGSSRKLKLIDGPVPYGLAEVLRMELAAGYYRREYNPDGRRRLFFVAEQLAELVPEAVDVEGVEFKGERVPSIKVDQVLPVLARAIQELAAQVQCIQESRP